MLTFYPTCTSATVTSKVPTCKFICENKFLSFCSSQSELLYNLCLFTSMWVIIKKAGFLFCFFHSYQLLGSRAGVGLQQ